MGSKSSQGFAPSFSTVFPSGFVKPQLRQIRDASQQAFETAPSLVAGFDPATERALSGIESLASANDPLRDAAQQRLLDTISGNLPSADARLQAAFNRVSPRVRRRFALSGQSNSPLADAAVAEAFGNAAAPILAQQDALAQQAALAAPQFSQTGFNNLTRLLGVGQARQSQQERLAQEPFQRLGLFTNLIQSINPGSSQASFEPTFSSPLAENLGLATSLFS